MSFGSFFDRSWLIYDPTLGFVILVHSTSGGAEIMACSGLL